MSRAVAAETTRGWRITKEKASQQIDVVVALAQAALGAMQPAYVPLPRIVTIHDEDESPTLASSPER